MRRGRGRPPLNRKKLAREPIGSSFNEKKRFRRDYATFYNDPNLKHRQQSSDESPRSSSVSSADESTSDVTCPVKGCSGDYHMCSAYGKHRFKEACMIYHNMSTDECQKINLARKFVCGFSREVDAEAYNFRISTKEQTRMAKEVEMQRDQFDECLRKKISKGYYDDVLQLGKLDRSREPRLHDFAISRDLELFRMAQVAAAEELERQPQYLNRPCSRIKTVRFGTFEIDALNPSCYPEDVSRCEKIYICEFCLKYTKSLAQLLSHSAKCTFKHPPGTEMYKKQALSVWQVDGSENKIFCQNLCLLAKLFLDHKTLYYDVEPFLFYILTETADHVSHIIGYFSKEKASMMNCNLSCLLILPPYQSRGYGKFLIELSYLLSKMDDKIGSPEHPLSDLGLIAYRSYWKEKIVDYMLELSEEQGFCVKDLSQKTGIHINDLVSTLQYYGLVKYWRHEYWILKKQDFIDEHKRSVKKKAAQQQHLYSSPSRRLLIDTTCLKLPIIVKRGGIGGGGTGDNAGTGVNNANQVE